MKKKYIKMQNLILLIIMFLINWNGSYLNQNTIDNTKNDKKNFYGVLNTNETVENIYIDNKQADIPFYCYSNLDKESFKKKSKTDTLKLKEELKKNITFINLIEIDTIEYDNNNTISEAFPAIIITSKNNIKSKYMTNKKLTCNKIDKGINNDQNPIYEKRSLDFSKVLKLQITGFNYIKETLPSKKINSIEKKNYISNEKFEQTTIENNSTEIAKTEKSAAAILDEIESNIKDLHANQDPTIFEKIKNNILNLINRLKEQFVKIINML